MYLPNHNYATNFPNIKKQETKNPLFHYVQPICPIRKTNHQYTYNPCQNPQSNVHFVTIFYDPNIKGFAKMKCIPLI